MRAALSVLRREGWVTVRQGLRRSIVHKPPEIPPPEPRIIALVSPEPLHEIVPHSQSWNNSFREAIAREGYAVQVHCGRRWYGLSPEVELAALTTHSPAAAWVLFLSSAAMQNWFASSGRAAVVSGSLHPGANLPMVDLDHRATCRHAVGRFAAMGHRRLVLLRSKHAVAGDLESEKGFFEGIAATTGATGSVLNHDGSPETIRRAIPQILRRRPIPTGIFVLRASTALVVVSELIKIGARVPDDISVISRDSDHFLDYFSPGIARYEADPRRHAQRLAKVVLHIAGKGLIQNPQIRLIARFRLEESLGKTR